MLIELGSERPLYRAVTVALREAILTGRLEPGSALPSSPTPARELGVSRIVAVAAYEQLAAEGYIVSSPGSGSRVAVGLDLPHRAAGAASPSPVSVSAYAARALALVPNVSTTAPADGGSTVDFRYGTFEPEERTQRAWSRSLSRAGRAAEFDYPDPAGLEGLRQEICRHLRRHRGIDAIPGDVLVVTGSQQALDLVVRALCEEGTPVGIEDPHYQGARRSFLAMGARLVPCALDEGALDISRHAARLRGVRAIYVTPSHQFPTGAVMNVERRLNLLAWAHERGTWVIEDDYDSEFHYGTGTIPALRGLDASGRVIYVGTFARTLSPELRLGYIVVPPALRDTFHAIKWLADRGSSPIGQRALATMMASGTYERAQRRMARSLSERRQILLLALQARFHGRNVRWSGSGAHAFLRFPELAPDDAELLVAEGVRHGVRMYSASPHYLLPPESATLLCGFASLTRDEIERGIERFAAAYFAIAG
jgi:GntR family transcriptional regulator / MocR family aminotransferase